jgi:hypothetical protein
MNSFKEFIIETFGLQFILQFMGGKVIDYIKDKNRVLFDEDDLGTLFFDVFELLFKKNNLEFDAGSIFDIIDTMELRPKEIEKEDVVAEILRYILGEDYEERYGTNYVSDWSESLKECIVNRKYDLLFKKMILNKSEYFDENLDKIYKEFTNIRIEIDNNLANEEDRWKKLEENRSEQELEIALMYIEDKEYDLAIKSLKKISVWTKQPQIKFFCNFKLGFCYSKLEQNVNGYRKAIKYLMKSEKYTNPENSDMVLLFLNLGLLFTMIGTEEEKVKNYEIANQYFENALEYIKEDDTEYMIDIMLHISRNIIDVCDELQFKEVDHHLTYSMLQMLDIYFKNEKLSEFHGYMLLHNLGRMFYHKAEKEGKSELLGIARSFYLAALDMNYVKKNKNDFAIVNENIAFSYFYDTEYEFKEKIEKSLAYSTIAYKLYEDICEKKHDHRIIEIQLFRSILYRKLYSEKHNVRDYELSEEILMNILHKISYLPKNSINIRTYLAIIELYYYRALNDKKNRTEYIDKAEMIYPLLDSLLHNNYTEKSKYTYEIMKGKIILVKMAENADQELINSCINNLATIVDATCVGNVNISRAAEELLLQFQHIKIANQSI